MKKLKKDFLFVAVILLFGVIAALVLFFTKKQGAFLDVRVDGETVARYPLDIDAEYDIGGVGSGKNHLVVKNGEAFIDSATCPDEICMKMGHIRYIGSSLICLPNKVVISIVGNDESGVDTVSGQ